MLIVKLRQRVADPANKETLELSIDDLEFYQCHWHALDESESLIEPVWNGNVPNSAEKKGSNRTSLELFLGDK